MIAKDLWEKIDGKVLFAAGVVCTVTILKFSIAFVLWATPVVKGNWILKLLFGWLF